MVSVISGQTFTLFSAIGKAHELFCSFGWKRGGGGGA